MNKKELIKIRNTNWNKYSTPGCPRYYKRKRNAIFISVANSLAHEQKKLEVCYNLKKEGKEFITEAYENATGLIRDIVCLDDNEITEIETNPKRAEKLKKSGYLKENVEVIGI